MWKWVERVKARRRVNTHVGFWFHANYMVPSLSRANPQLGRWQSRGKQALGALAASGLVRARSIQRPHAISLRDLTRVHHAEYLEGTGMPDTIAPIFGLQPHEAHVDELLRAQRLAVGGTVAAARWSVREAGRVGFNLGGGFHHAGPRTGAGFCIYNDIAVAIAILRKDGFSGPIAIVDLDFHQGNGNIEAFEKDPTVFTFSIQGSAWQAFDAVANWEIDLPAGTDDATYLAELDRALPTIAAEHRPEMVFYVAGTDVLREDELGTWSLSHACVLERDRRVSAWAQALGCPMVVCLAGGYSPQAWESSARYALWLLTDDCSDAWLPDDDVASRYASIARTLDPFELQREEDGIQLTEEDVLAHLDGIPRSRRLLGYYSTHGLELVLERYGALSNLRDMGFYDLRVSVDLGDPDRQRILIHGAKAGTYHLLVELVLARRILRPKHEGLEGDEPLELLSIEWLRLQDPTARFTEKRPQLPGQEHPGLGKTEDVMALLFQACERLELDGIIQSPSRYHIAALSIRAGCFLDPEIQGRFDALRETFKDVPLGDVSRWFDEHRVHNRAGDELPWMPDDFVSPHSPRLQRYFESDSYRTARSTARKAFLDEGVLGPGAEQ